MLAEPAEEDMEGNGAPGLRALVGGVFIKMTEDELNEHLEARKERAEVEATEVDEIITDLEKVQEGLKTGLYSRFGNQINLEY